MLTLGAKQLPGSSSSPLVPLTTQKSSSSTGNEGRGEFFYRTNARKQFRKEDSNVTFSGRQMRRQKKDGFKTHAHLVTRMLAAGLGNKQDMEIFHKYHQWGIIHSSSLRISENIQIMIHMAQVNENNTSKNTFLYSIHSLASLQEKPSSFTHCKKRITK